MNEQMSHRHKSDGYRYVRESRRYRCRANGHALRTHEWPCGRCGDRSQVTVATWALYEVRDGRARRVGTARSEGEWRAFLGLYGATNDPTTSEV